MNNVTKNIIICSIVIFFIVISIMATPLQAGDEFINYYNTYKIFNGEIIYKDVNIVSTPLLFYLGILFFKLLNPSLIVFRIYNICINILIAIFIYKTFINLKIKRIYSIIYSLLLEIIIVKYVVVWGATYNILALLFCLVGLNIYINRDKTKYFNLIQGIIIFLILMSKQNIGIYYSIAYILTELILNKKYGFKDIIKTFGITIIMLFTYIIYLFFMDNLENFISYTIIGIKEFSKNIRIKEIECIIIDLIIIFFISFVIIKRKYSNKEYRNLIILYIFGICMLMIGYPIVDKWHMIVASLILFICMLYTIHNTFILELEINEKTIKVVIILMMLIISIFSTIRLNKFVSIVYMEKTSKFYLIPISEEFKIKIEHITKFLLDIKDKKVAIISPEAGIYKININLKGDGIYDVPFLGNLGKNGENGLINRIFNYKEGYVLVHSQKKYWQESDKFREYIEKNYEKKGNIDDFDIYYIE